MGKNVCVGTIMLLAVFSAAVLVVTRAAAQETILYNFIGGRAGGSDPEGAPIFDAAGNLYASTCYGAEYNHGSVIELTPAGVGNWAETVLHVFDARGSDGHCPRGSLVLDSAGNIYGTTDLGGVYNLGTIFELSPSTGGIWTETFLHHFGSGHDGASPIAGLIFDASGNLYGTTIAGGAYNSGTVFELTPNAGGSWTETILHNFRHNGLDGTVPGSSLVFDASGNLYGTTASGGSYNQGTVFELAQGAGGSWTEITLYSFGADKDGKDPYSNVIFDSAGNLYGTTSEGGDHANGGTLFELMPQTGGLWTETILHDFGQSYTDGNQPDAGLIIDSAGTLYGTTRFGGTYGEGTVFELTPTAGGSWMETILHRYGSGNDGTYPDAGLSFDALGNLYGTTSGGGIDGGGTVYEIAP